MSSSHPLRLNRVVVCGARKVGKTAIIQQLLYGNVTKESKLYPTIEDIYISSIATDRGIREKVQLCDYSGTRGLKEIPKHFHYIADGYVLVLALDDDDSALQADTFRRDIERNKERRDAPLIVLANKSDLASRSNKETVLQWAHRERLRMFERRPLFRLFKDTVRAMDKRIYTQKFLQGLASNQDSDYKCFQEEEADDKNSERRPETETSTVRSYVEVQESMRNTPPCQLSSGIEDVGDEARMKDVANSQSPEIKKMLSSAKDEEPRKDFDDLNFDEDDDDDLIREEEPDEPELPHYQVTPKAKEQDESFTLQPGNMYVLSSQFPQFPSSLVQNVGTANPRVADFPVSNSSEPNWTLQTVNSQPPVITVSAVCDRPLEKRQPEMDNCFEDDRTPGKSSRSSSSLSSRGSTLECHCQDVLRSPVLQADEPCVDSDVSDLAGKLLHPRRASSPEVKSCFQSTSNNQVGFGYEDSESEPKHSEAQLKRSAESDEEAVSGESENSFKCEVQKKKKSEN
ncbi:unnamed protein product [Cyprideis torosa]|uniref:Uncharacterized protein n=1 Tax=Cyprideis torosa TaxID=163714 RepID=A0A7R8W7Y8_9CRUS|nr:unnamed protein product [Cyprideis torosa]CAG0885692.1 unnamed protein product [Cyprideis torosa]